MEDTALQFAKTVLRRRRQLENEGKEDTYCSQIRSFSGKSRRRPRENGRRGTLPTPDRAFAGMRSIVQRRRFNERVDEDVPKLDELFLEQDVLEPDWIPAEVSPVDNRPEAPVSAENAPAEEPFLRREKLAQDQPTGVRCKAIQTGDPASHSAWY